MVHSLESASFSGLDRRETSRTFSASEAVVSALFQTLILLIWFAVHLSMFEVMSETGLLLHPSFSRDSLVVLGHVTFKCRASFAVNRDSVCFTPLCLILTGRIEAFLLGHKLFRARIVDAGPKDIN
jgi:hypothetical protein